VCNDRDRATRTLSVLAKIDLILDPQNLLSFGNLRASFSDLPQIKGEFLPKSVAKKCIPVE
jgi:hypothetical protein